MLYHLEKTTIISSQSGSADKIFNDLHPLAAHGEGGCDRAFAVMTSIVKVCRFVGHASRAGEGMVP